jgi:hypothetical protein
MARSGLPKALGGDLRFQELVQWQELRVRQEWGLPIGVSTRDTAGSYQIMTAPFIENYH